MPRSQFLVLLAAIAVVSLFSSALTLSFVRGESFPLSVASNQPTLGTQSTPSSDSRGAVDLLSLQSSVQGIARDVSPSVVSIVMSRDVRVYRGDRYGLSRRYQ
ncbi:MAG TPA: hypothetical protein PK765_07030 [bacterium]|nr:hypothetical protein [bacterium]